MSCRKPVYCKRLVVLVMTVSSKPRLFDDEHEKLFLSFLSIISLSNKENDKMPHDREDAHYTNTHVCLTSTGFNTLGVHIIWKLYGLT